MRTPAVPLKIGNLRSPEVLLALFGLLVMAGLFLRKVRGAIFIGIAATAALAIFAGFGHAPQRVFALPFA